jgi:alpha-glucosidase
VPLPWEANASASNGFSPNGAAWLPQPASYADYSRNRQTGVQGSTLEMYREALELRKELSLGSGSFEWVREFCGETSLGFLNQEILVIHNFGTDSLPLPEGELLASSSTASQAIEPNQTVWLRLK